jgi:hypothetical protein
VSSANSEFLVAFVLGAGAGTAVFFHAVKNGIKHPSGWAAFVFMTLVIGLPTYAIHVRRTRKNGPPRRF